MIRETQPKTSLAQKISDLKYSVSQIPARLFRHRGIDVVTTGTREERVSLLIQELARVSSEGGGIQSIRAALGGEDGDMDELAEALNRTELLRGAKAEQIRVRRTPEGPAPEDYRKCWIGVELMGIRIPNSSGDVDFLTGNEITTRGEVFITGTRRAINLLENRSLGAGRWFRQNFPQDLPFLSFRADEVEVVPQNLPVGN